MTKYKPSHDDNEFHDCCDWHWDHQQYYTPIQMGLVNALREANYPEESISKLVQAAVDAGEKLRLARED